VRTKKKKKNKKTHGGGGGGGGKESRNILVDRGMRVLRLHGRRVQGKKTKRRPWKEKEQGCHDREIAQMTIDLPRNWEEETQNNGGKKRYRWTGKSAARINLTGGKKKEKKQCCRERAH